MGKMEGKGGKEIKDICMFYHTDQNQKVTSGIYGGSLEAVLT